MAAVAAGTEPLPEVLVAYGKHKFQFVVTGATPTCATVVQILVQNHVRVPAAWCKLLLKARELDLAEPFSKFRQKRGKITKLRLKFTRAFSELGVEERESRLEWRGGKGDGGDEGGCGAASSGAGKASTTEAIGASTTRAVTAMNSVVDESAAPASWAIGVTVIHGKLKLYFYFDTLENATIAALQDRIYDRVGVAVKHQRLLVRGGVVGSATAENAPKRLIDLLPVSKQKRDKKKLMVKVRLMHDARYHDAQRAVANLKGSISERLTELERVVGGMHRKVQHNFFDEAQMIVNGRSFREEIDALANSVAHLNAKSGVANVKEGTSIPVDALARVEELLRMSDEIEVARMGSLRSKRKR